MWKQYEKETGHKRFSITTRAGAKIQPYFDVLPPIDSNLYFFRVQSEVLDNGLVRIWVTASTARELKSLIGDLSVEKVSETIVQTTSESPQTVKEQKSQFEVAVSLNITPQAYESLVEMFSGVNDEHMMQLLVKHLAGR